MFASVAQKLTETTPALTTTSSNNTGLLGSLTGVTLSVAVLVGSYFHKHHVPYAVSLKELDEKELAQIREIIISQPDLIRLEGDCVVNNIDEKIYNSLMDSKTKPEFSQFYLSKTTEKLKAFILARESEESAFNKAPLGKRVVFVERYGIYPKYRKCHNVGKKLFHMLAKMAQKEGIDELRLLVYKANRFAVSIYLTFGFEPVNLRQDVPYDGLLLSTTPQNMLACIYRLRPTDNPATELVKTQLVRQIYENEQQRVAQEKTKPLEIA